MYNKPVFLPIPQIFPFQLLKPGIKCPTGGDLNAFEPRVDNIRYKMSYLKKESRQMYKNFGR